MTTALFAAGLAAIVGGTALVALAVLLERGGTAEPDAAESTLHPKE